MAKLILERSSEWMNRFRHIKIYLDNDEIGVIGNGKIQTFDIASGKHELKATIDWCGSNTLLFEINDTETQHVKLSGFRFGRMIVFITILLTLSFLFLGEIYKYILITAVPAGLYLGYKLTLGRNSYLVLKKK